jgi:hypothetical protein
MWGSAVIRCIRLRLSAVLSQGREETVAVAADRCAVGGICFLYSEIFTLYEMLNIHTYIHTYIYAS